MKIEIESEMAKVYTPFNSDFVKKIKRIGGAKWNGSEKCWCIPSGTVDIAREIMREVYGHSDIDKNETAYSEIHADIILFNKILSHANSRDGGAKVGADVAYTSGGATSGGSMKNWRSVVEDGSICILENVNRNVYEREISALKYNVDVEVVENKIKKNKAKLLEEKENLLKRISEIDKILEM